jgi:hypothetical protein
MSCLTFFGFSLRNQYFAQLVEDPANFIGSNVFMPLSDGRFAKGTIVYYNTSDKMFEIKYYPIQGVDEKLYASLGSRQMKSLPEIQESLMVTNFNQGIIGRYIAIHSMDFMTCSAYAVVGYNTKSCEHILIPKTVFEKYIRPEVPPSSRSKDVVQLFYKFDKDELAAKVSFNLNNPHNQARIVLFSSPLNADSPDFDPRHLEFFRIQLFSGSDSVGTLNFGAVLKLSRASNQEFDLTRVPILFEANGDKIYINMRSQSTAWTFADKGNNTVGKPIASGIVSLLDGVVDPDSNARFSNIEIAILFLHRAKEFTELFTSSKEFGAKIGTMKQ